MDLFFNSQFLHWRQGDLSLFSNFSWNGRAAYKLWLNVVVYRTGHPTDIDAFINDYFSPSFWPFAVEFTYFLRLIYSGFISYWSRMNLCKSSVPRV